jgi:hypothetical protein
MCNDSLLRTFLAAAIRVGEHPSKPSHDQEGIGGMQRDIIDRPAVGDRLDGRSWG